jgi:hypothetical protein
MGTAARKTYTYLGGSPLGAGDSKGILPHPNLKGTAAHKTYTYLREGVSPLGAGGSKGILPHPNLKGTAALLQTLNFELLFNNLLHYRLPIC